MNILELDHINKSYGTHHANRDISFSVPQGSVFGLLGPNGAGKSTLIRIITNIIAADSGSIRINGERFKGQHNQIIGYMPEERGLYKKMMVGEHLVYLGRLKGLSKADATKKVKDWLERLSIGDWWGKKIEDLSKGMQQKVQFIATTLHDPILLILDEPFSGLDPVNSVLIKDEIFELRRKGASVIFSTHRMEQVEEICEEIVLINNGQNILQGFVKEIRQRFKEYKYQVLYNGTSSFVQLPGYEIVQQTEGAMILKALEGQSPNQLLRTLLDNGLEIHHFNEILPSINEIFIRQVQTP
ncbi:ABC transporter ATP-binding protein [soil metagenome]